MIMKCASSTSSAPGTRNEKKSTARTLANGFTFRLVLHMDGHQHFRLRQQNANSMVFLYNGYANESYSSTPTAVLLDSSVILKQHSAGNTNMEALPSRSFTVEFNWLSVFFLGRKRGEKNG